MRGAAGEQDSQSVEPVEPVVGQLDGHLTRMQLETTLAVIGEEIAARGGKLPVLLDCSNMSGYDLDSRHAFVEWNQRWRAQVSRVAIVTSNRLYHVVISTMSLASGQAMKGFAEAEAAQHWARTGVTQ